MDLDEVAYTGAKRSRDDDGDVVDDIERPLRRARATFPPPPTDEDFMDLVLMDDDPSWFRDEEDDLMWIGEQNGEDDVTSFSDLNADVVRSIMGWLDDVSRSSLSMASRHMKKWHDESDNYPVPISRYYPIFHSLFLPDQKTYFVPDDFPELRKPNEAPISHENLQRVWDSRRKMSSTQDLVHQKLLPLEFIETLNEKGAIFFGLYDRLVEITGVLLEGDPIDFDDNADGKITPTRDLIAETQERDFRNNFTLSAETAKTWRTPELWSYLNMMLATIFSYCLLARNLPLWERIRNKVTDRFFRTGDNESMDAFGMVHGVTADALTNARTTRIQQIKFLRSICQPKDVTYFASFPPADIHNKRVGLIYRGRSGNWAIRLRETVFDTLFRSPSFGLSDIVEHLDLFRNDRHDALFTYLITKNGGLENVDVDIELMRHGGFASFRLRQAMREHLNREAVFDIMQRKEKLRKWYTPEAFASFALIGNEYYKAIDGDGKLTYALAKTPKRSATASLPGRFSYGPRAVKDIWFSGPLAYEQRRNGFSPEFLEGIVSAVTQTGKGKHSAEKLVAMSSLMASIMKGSIEDYSLHELEYRTAFKNFPTTDPRFAYDCVTAALKYASYTSPDHLNHGILYLVNHAIDEGVEKRYAIEVLARNILYTLFTMPFDDVQPHTPTLDAIDFEKVMRFLGSMDPYSFALSQQGHYLAEHTNERFYGGYRNNPGKRNDDKIAKVVKQLLLRGRLDTVILLHMATGVEAKHRMSTYIKGHAEMMRGYVPPHLFWQIPYFNDYFEHSKINRLYFSKSRTNFKERLRIADD